MFRSKWTPLFAVLAIALSATFTLGYAPSAQAAPATSATIDVNIVLEPTAGEKVVITKITHKCAEKCSLFITGSRTLKTLHWVGFVNAKMIELAGSGPFTDLQLEVIDGERGEFETKLVLHDKWKGEWTSGPIKVPACDYVPPTTKTTVPTTVKPTTTKPHHPTTTVPATTTTTTSTSTTAPTTTTTAPQPTTTKQEEVIVPVTTSPAPPDTTPAARETLPVTGSNTWKLVLIGAALTIIGGLLIALTKPQWLNTALTSIKRLIFGGDDPIAA